jgi:hypothetical protein
VLDEHWDGRDRFQHGGDPRGPMALPAGVACYAMAGTISPLPGARLLASDGVVPVDSALGVHDRPEMTLRFPDAHRWIGYGVHHLELLARGGEGGVYATLRGWMGEEP